MTTWERNAEVKEGSNIIDPPIVKSYERDLQDASAAADVDLIAYHTERYNEARENVVKHAEAADKKAKAGDKS